jgi:hypothetical protein
MKTKNIKKQYYTSVSRWYCQKWENPKDIITIVVEPVPLHPIVAS